MEFLCLKYPSGGNQIYNKVNIILDSGKSLSLQRGMSNLYSETKKNTNMLIIIMQIMLININEVHVEKLMSHQPKRN